MTLRISRTEARRIHLAAQGLAVAWPEKPATKADVLAAIRQMAALQIDTISVVARSPYFVLWSRLGMYEPKWLDELLAEGAIFEYWAHAACFLPSEDYPFYRQRMLDPESRFRKHLLPWREEHHEAAEAMLGHIRARGPVRSADFDRPDGEKGGGWWDWKTEKRLLEFLFLLGELMIARRQNFQRLYDLTERVRPSTLLEPELSRGEAQAALVLRAARALGVAKLPWLPGYLMLHDSGVPAKRTALAAAREAITAATAAGEIVPVEVEGWNEPAVVHRDCLEALASTRAMPPRTTLLSPFDPVCWDRARALDLFDFDYRIECYTPAPKRKYGYFSLPILHGDALVGRLDAKAHRREGLFEVKSLHLEGGVPLNQELVAGLRDVLRRCANWHNTPEVVVRNANRPQALDALSHV